MATSKIQFILEVDDKGNAKLRKFEQGLKDTDKTAKQTSGSMKEGFLAVGVALGAMTVAALAAKKAFDFSAEGAQILRLEQAGDSLALRYGQNMDAIVRAIQRGSGGTITGQNAILQANKALLLGVAQTPAEFEKLAASSLALGRAMGRGAGEAIDDITTGIGRMSPLILDNLGITTQGGRVYDIYAQSIGKATDELTDAEKKQALLNTTFASAAPLLDEQGNLTADLATDYERLNAQLKDYLANQAKIAAQSGLARAFVTGTADRAQAVNMLAEAQERSLISEEEALEMLRRINISNANSSIITAELTMRTREYEQAISSAWTPAVVRQMELAAEGMEPFRAKLADIREEFGGVRLAAGSLFDAIDPSFARRLEDALGQLEFREAGGVDLQRLSEQVLSAVDTMRISPEQGQELLEGLFVASQDLEVELGNITAAEAAKNISDTLNVSLTEARDLLQNADDILTTLERTVKVVIVYETLGSPPPEIPGSQYGGIVPGPPGSRRLMMLHGGEEVVPAGRVMQDNRNQSMFSGGTVNINNGVTSQTFDRMMDNWLRTRPG